MPYYYIGYPDDALYYLQKSLIIREEILLSNHPDLAESYGNIAQTYHMMGRFQDAAQYMQRATDILSHASLSPTHPRREDTQKYAQQFEQDI